VCSPAGRSPDQASEDGDAQPRRLGLDRGVVQVPDGPTGR
jgi:hypothetical protein